MPVDLLLLQPESPGNIGSVARVMKNFSFSRLVLVNPCEISGETRGFAMHAWDIVRKARILDEMPWDSYDLLVGTSGLKHSVMPCVTPEELSKRLDTGTKKKVALVFGRESTGLSGSEMERCDLVCRIPASSAYPVMNISHAASVILYELRKTGYKKRELAGRQQLSTLQNLYKEVIETINYPEKRKNRAYTCLRSVTLRGVLSGKEADALIGMFKKIREKTGD